MASFFYWQSHLKSRRSREVREEKTKRKSVSFAAFAFFARPLKIGRQTDRHTSLKSRRGRTCRQQLRPPSGACDFTFGVSGIRVFVRPGWFSGAEK